MCGDGVISVRLPLSLLGLFRATAEQHSISFHEAARRWISYLPSLSRDDLDALREPPHEFDTPKVSLYVGWRAVDVLTVATRNCTLTNSTILRRLLYGLLVTNELRFVLQNESWELKIVPEKNTGNADFDDAEKGPSCA
jgi:hypothetical protein